MTRLDTLSLLVPEDTVRWFRTNSFLENSSLDLGTGEVTTTKQAKAQHLPIGVSQLKYKDGRDYILTISAKTLKDNYLEGININTWEQAIRGVDEILDIDTNKLWDANPKVLRCDTTDNINIEQIGHSKREICWSLYQNKMNPRFVSKWYESTKKLGLEFAGTQKEKNRIICYDKTKDLDKSANQKFMQSLVNPLLVRNVADKTLRFETNHTTKRSILDRFKILDNNLHEVLGSVSPVNHNFLKKVLGSDYQISLFEEWKNFDGDPNSFIYRKGVENIIKQLDFDAGQIKRFIKEIYGESNYKYHWHSSKNSIKKLLIELKMDNVQNTPKETESICKDIMELLRVAI